MHNCLFFQQEYSTTLELVSSSQCSSVRFRNKTAIFEVPYSLYCFQISFGLVWTKSTTRIGAKRIMEQERSPNNASTEKVSSVNVVLTNRKSMLNKVDIISSVISSSTIPVKVSLECFTLPFKMAAARGGGKRSSAEKPPF